MADFANNAMQPAPNKSGPELEFRVMPRAQTDNSESAPTGSENKNSGFDGGATRSGFFKSKMFRYLGLATVLLLALGVLVYVFLLRPKIASRTNPKPSNVPQINVPAAPQANLDSDHDGLTDAEEASLGTDPHNPDTDHDGIADGDEVHIYHTDPLLPDTNGNGYDDGTEIANGYDPTAKPSQKADASVLQAWARRINQYGLHEPTITTLKLKLTKTSGDRKQQTYVNRRSGFALDIPPSLSFRESADAGEAGIFINGTTPSDSNLASDPISVSLGVKASGESLADWLKSQYPDSSYQKQEPVVAFGGAKGVRLQGIKNDICPQDKVFFDKNDRVIILTFTCNTLTPFEPLFQGIALSFRVQP